GTATMTSGTGTCTITFSQSGSNNYNAAPNIVQGATATKAASTVTTPVASGINTFGQTITISTTLSVAGGGTPSGTITFNDGLTIIGTANVNAGAGTYSIFISSLAVGSHSITATFNGDTNVNASAPSA